MRWEGHELQCQQRHPLWLCKGCVLFPKCLCLQRANHTPPGSQSRAVPTLPRGAGQAGHRQVALGLVTWSRVYSRDREKKDKTSEQHVQMSPRRQALEGRRSSLGREGQQRPCLKAVSTYLGEITMLNSDWLKKNPCMVAGTGTYCQTWKEGQLRTRAEELEKHCSIGGYVWQSWGAQVSSEVFSTN